MKSPEDVAAKRGKTVEEILNYDGHNLSVIGRRSAAKAKVKKIKVTATKSTIARLKITRPVWLWVLYRSHCGRHIHQYVA